jgi:hypothetical protein
MQVIFRWRAHVHGASWVAEYVRLMNDTFATLSAPKRWLVYDAFVRSSQSRLRELHGTAVGGESPLTRACIQFSR